MSKNFNILSVSNTSQWWNEMFLLRKQVGRENFTKWVASEIRCWRIREVVIRLMADNDHNSDYFLSLQSILKTHRFDDGVLVTARIVAESLDAMLS